MDLLWSLVIALVLGSASAHILKRAAQPCAVNGKVVKDGETFTLPLAGPCVKFVCKDGGVFPQEYGCERDGSCHPVGDTYNIGCIQRRCGPLNGNFGYSRINEGCSVKDVCVGVNETYQEGCFKYKCLKKGTDFALTYILEMVESGCSNGGKCYPENHTLEVQCRTMKCQKVNNVVQFVNVEQGCQLGPTQCIKLGETKTDSCRTFICHRQDVQGIPYYSVDPISTKCEDSNLDCHDPGTYFSFKMGGQVRPNCTCHVEGYNVQYFC